jgi:twitching motility protein PilT
MSSPTNPAVRPPSVVPPAAASVAASAAVARAATAAAPAAAPISTPELLASMLRTSAKISDLFFSPGKPPLVEINGKLAPAGATRALTSEDTRRIAADLIGNNQHATDNLNKLGSCDVSYSLPGANRFRVNVFMQRGTCAVVMRVIPGKAPDFESLNLPAELGKIVELRNGIVLVTGPTGSGKSSTLAAIIDKINKEQFYHVLTIEDPIEFLHPHKNCIVHQRELHADTPALRSP